MDSVFVSTDGVKPDAAEVSYIYTASGATSQINYKGPKDVNYGYTIRGWVESINDMGSGNFAASYHYLKNGNIDSAGYYNPLISDASISSQYRYDYSYDGLNRLIGADYRIEWTEKWGNLQ